MYACNSSTWEVEAGRSQVWGSSSATWGVRGQPRMQDTLTHRAGSCFGVPPSWQVPLQSGLHERWLPHPMMLSKAGASRYQAVSYPGQHGCPTTPRELDWRLEPTAVLRGASASQQSSPQHSTQLALSRPPVCSGRPHRHIPGDLQKGLFLECGRTLTMFPPDTGMTGRN